MPPVRAPLKISWSLPSESSLTTIKAIFFSEGYHGRQPEAHRPSAFLVEPLFDTMFSTAMDVKQTWPIVAAALLVGIPVGAQSPNAQSPASVPRPKAATSQVYPAEQIQAGEQRF